MDYSTYKYRSPKEKGKNGAKGNVPVGITVVPVRIEDARLKAIESVTTTFEPRVLGISEI